MWKSHEPPTKGVLLHFLQLKENKLFALIISSHTFHRGEVPEDTVSSEKIVETIPYFYVLAQVGEVKRKRW